MVPMPSVVGWGGVVVGVIARSRCALTVVDCVLLVSFVWSGSGCAPETLAVVVRVKSGVGVTITSTNVLAPAVRFAAHVHVTTPAAWEQVPPFVADANTKVGDAGIVSVNVTPLAGEVLRFLMPIV